MTNEKAVSEAKTLDWMTAFENEPELYTLFPLTLGNGKQVPGIHIVCSGCGNQISGDRIHGRVVQSLPSVVTVTANAMCAPCDRITHIDCRFRADGKIAVVEWLGSNGRWQSRLMQPRSTRVRVVDAFRRLLTRLSSGSS